MNLSKICERVESVLTFLVYIVVYSALGYGVINLFGITTEPLQVLSTVLVSMVFVYYFKITVKFRI